MYPYLCINKPMFCGYGLTSLSGIVCQRSIAKNVDSERNEHEAELFSAAVPRTEQLEPPTVEISMLVLQGDDVMKIVE